MHLCIPLEIIKCIYFSVVKGHMILSQRGYTTTFRGNWTLVNKKAIGQPAPPITIMLQFLIVF